MDRIIKILFFCLLLLMVFSFLGAQQTGEIRGKITDEQGEVLPGVAVIAKSPNLQGLRTAISDKNGIFRLLLLPIGIYSLTFELPGFEKVTIVEQSVRLGFAVSLAVILKPAVVAEEITVTAAIPLIDKIKADNSYRLNSDDLSHIPAQARTIAEVVDLTPGVTGVRVNTVSGGANSDLGTETGLPSFRGEGDSGNNWLVDGLSTKGVTLKSDEIAVRVNYDAWEDVQIVSDGFSPEMGQGVGGFINIVTKSGSNAFHGELGGLVRDRHLRAKRQEQLSTVSVPETSIQQYFGNLGGPIVRDKLWFFLSDNFFGNFDKTSQQSIGWLTVPEGERRTGATNVFGKITFTPYKNHNVTVSGLLDKFLYQTGGIGVPETYTRTAYTRYSYRLNYQGIFSQNTLLSAAGGLYRTENSVGPLSGSYSAPAYLWQDIGQITNNATYGYWEIERRTDVMASLTHFVDLGRWGNHQVKVGLSYYSNGLETIFQGTGREADPWLGNGFDNGIFITWAALGNPIELAEYGIGESNNVTRGFGFYAEDNIVLDRFSLMFGLRTDTQRVFNDVGTKVWSWGLGDFLQPRASCSFDLTGDGQNVIKFAYGMFSMPLPSRAFVFFNSNPGFTCRYYSWFGPGSPTEIQLKDPANWDFVWEQSTTAVPEEVDPQLKPDKVNKFLLEFDRQLSPNWALKVRGIYSSSHNLLEDVGIYAPENPSELKYIFTNFELKKRDYRAVEVELNGRIPGRLALNASYTWSQAKGTCPGNYFESGTWDVRWQSTYYVGFFGDRPFMPEGSMNKPLYDEIFAGLGGRGIGDEGWYGFLPYSVNHIVKVSGIYFAPLGIHISTNIEYLSGYHWEKKGWSPAYGGFVTFPEGRGGRVTPPHMYLDLALEKDILLKKGITLGIGVNAYNLTNSQRPVSYVKNDNSLFGQVWARQMPRWTQINATLKF